jgi:hypothetical protein
MSTNICRSFVESELCREREHMGFAGLADLRRHHRKKQLVLGFEVAQTVPTLSRRQCADPQPGSEEKIRSA